MPNIIEKQLKEFDEKFPRTKETDRDYYNPWIPDAKSFLSSSLLSAVEERDKEWREKVGGMKKLDINYPNMLYHTEAEKIGYNKALDTLLEEMKKNETPTYK